MKILKVFQKYDRAFTIVELLITIVVIGILAALVAVSYNGMKQKAMVASLKSDLRNASKQLAIDYTLNNNYPATINDANDGKGLKSSNDTTLQYYKMTSDYCISANSTSTPTLVFHILSSSGVIEDGNCTKTWKSIAYGGNSSSSICGITNDDVAYCWGNNSNGQMGNGTTNFSAVPVKVSQGEMPNGVTFSQISVGSVIACGVGSDDKAYCWSDYNTNYLGNGGEGVSLTPVLVHQGDMPAGVTIKTISVGGMHTCVIASDNLPYCWGYGTYGQLGDGTGLTRSTPTLIAQGAMPDLYVKAIIAGRFHTCAIGSDDKAYCWGDGGYGRLGNGGVSDQDSPVAVLQGEMPSDNTVSLLTSGIYHNCVVAKYNGKMYCWGYNSDGQLGFGYSGTPTYDRTTPVAVLDGDITSGSTISSISASNNESCATDASGKAYCWGSGGFGDLGNGANVDSSIPEMVSQGDIPSGYAVKQLSVAYNYVCTIATNDKVYCWGQNNTPSPGGKLGLDSGITTNVNTPNAVKTIYYE